MSTKVEPASVARVAATMILKTISQYPDEDVYMSDIVSNFFFNEGEEFFTTNEEIIEELKSLISDDYTVEVLPVQKVFESEDEKDNFTYEDTIIKLKKND